jgi:hypothetical protein
MRRTVAAAALAVGIGAAGALPAFAGGNPGTPSGECRNGSPYGTDTERTVLTSPAYVGVEYAGANEPDGTFFATACYSDTPVGAPSNLAGGFVHARVSPAGWGVAWCMSDPGAAVQANCTDAIGVSLGDPNPATVGKTVGGSVAANGVGVTVNQTGAEVGNPSTTTNAPFGGSAGTGGSAGLGAGTCVYANTTTGTCPVGGLTVAGTTVNEADAVPSVTPSTPSGPPCTGINNSCLPLGVTVRALQDSSNPVLGGTVAGIPVPIPDPGAQCVQVNATC